MTKDELQGIIEAYSKGYFTIEHTMSAVEAYSSASNNGKPVVSGSGIDWQYFFGGSSGRSYDRYYKAEINGQRVEKHGSNRGVVYAIGNIDKAKKKYKSEAELLEACLPNR